MPQLSPEQASSCLGDDAKGAVSEVWVKLLGTVTLDNDEAEGLTPGIPADWSVNANAPERDGRVVWLIKEIGGSDAIGHRHEDILRQRYGRSLPGRGRPMVQPGNEDEDFGTEPDPGQPSMLQEVDARRVWRGLLVTADLQFERHDDISMLLRVLADVPDILEGSTGGQWPVKKIVTLLNQRFPPSYVEQRSRRQCEKASTHLDQPPDAKEWTGCDGP